MCDFFIPLDGSRRIYFTKHSIGARQSAGILYFCRLNEDKLISMALTDIILLAIVIIAAVTGALRGIVAQIGAIAALLAAILVCRFFGGTIADALVSHGSEHETTMRVLVYALVFVATYFGVWLLARLFGAAVSAMHLRPFDRIAGSLFRIAEWLIITSIVLNVYFAVCPSDKGAFCNPAKPWRAATVKIAPAHAGYITN